ncbi:MAG: dephospho-CoA kinase [Clostridia bacterium]|nr:dephospho-CoA kinase [Clostridia bacterium]
MFLIGLTGPTGAGKGALCRYLNTAYGIPSIDADAVYHDLLVPPSPCLDALAAEFGAEILCEDRTLDRKKLASIVFSSEDPSLRAARTKRLNEITHGFVMKKTAEILDEMEKRGERVVIFDAPALYEANADRICSLVVAVLADRETRISRIIARDGLSREQAEMRVRAQHPDTFYTERADAVLYNNGSVSAFDRVAEEFAKAHLSGIL